MAKPRFKDSCGHGQDSFVGRIQYRDLSKPAGYKNADVYAFPDRAYGTELCIRYGSKNYEYVSPGNIISLVRGSMNNNEMCANAVRLLEKEGRFVYEKGEP